MIFFFLFFDTNAVQYIYAEYSPFKLLLYKQAS